MAEMTKEQLLIIARARKRKAEAERQQAPSQDQRGSAADPLMQGLTFGFADELKGAVRGGIDYATGKAPTFGEGYSTWRDKSRGDLEAFRERNPVGSTALEVAGSLPTALLPMGAVARGAGLGGKVMAGAQAGGIQGGLYGFGSGEGGLNERLQNAKSYGTTGAGLGGALPVVARGVGQVARGVGQVAKALKPSAKVAPGVNLPERVQIADEFDMPISRGQATGNVIQQSREEGMRHGAYGQTAQDEAQGFANRQTAATQQATENIQREIAGNYSPVANVQEGAGQAVAGVKNRAAGYRSEANAAFDTAQAADVNIGARAVETAPQRIASGLDAANIKVDADLHPFASKALDEIQELGADASTTNQAIHWSRVEKVRRQIVAMKAAPGTDDARVLGNVKREFDKWFEDAVDSNLFSGDAAGLEALKRGRAAWSNYKAIVSPKSGDDAGRVIAKMATKDVSGQEAANWLHGAAAMGGQGTAYRVAKRLKETLGADSPEWSAVRQSYWQALTKGGRSTDAATDAAAMGDEALTRGSQDVANRIREFTRGKGRPLAEALFSPDELQKMERFGALQRMITASKQSTNPSKTSYSLVKLAGGLAKSIGASLVGVTAGGMISPEVGIATGIAAAGGQKLFSRWRGGRMATKAFGADPSTFGVAPGAKVEGMLNTIGAPGARALTPAYPQEDPLKRLPVAY